MEPSRCDRDSLAPLRLCVRVLSASGTKTHTPRLEREISAMRKEALA